MATFKGRQAAPSAPLPQWEPDIERIMAGRPYITRGWDATDVQRHTEPLMPARRETEFAPEPADRAKWQRCSIQDAGGGWETWWLDVRFFARARMREFQRRIGQTVGDPNLGRRDLA